MGAAAMSVQRLRDLAAELGVDALPLIEEYDERAGLREHLGGLTRGEAERLAFEDVERRWRRRERR